MAGRTADSVVVVPSTMTDSFGALLRRHRLAAVLTQERLAERAGISATGIAALETGRRRAPRATTVRLLIDALGLNDAAQAELVAAAAAERPGAEHAGDARRGNTGTSPATDHPAPNLAGNADNRRVFVGRPNELQALATAWQRRARVVVVAGEAGVGKTRLVEEFASSAALVDTASAPARVLWGRCTPTPLGVHEPFVAPVRAVLATMADAGEHFGELARMVPGLAKDRGWAGGAHSADPDVERRLLFEATAALFATLGPTLLVLDDLHWADAGSLALLAHLAGDEALGNLVIVALVRSADLSPTTAAALGDLRRYAAVERITLSGLPRDEVATLVRLLAGDRSSDRLIEVVADATEGNPLFVEELTEHLVAQGFGMGEATVSRLAGATVAVPSGVRETIAQRIASLSNDAKALLSTGAVLGRAFDVDIAAALAELPTDRFLAATEDALLSSLVAEQSAREIVFSHGLVQSAVYESISARRRLYLHRSAAVELERAWSAIQAGTGSTTGGTTGGATGNEELAFAIAHHWAIVAQDDPSAAAAAATWAQRAGDLAAAGADIDEAIVRYSEAEALWAGPTAEHIETLLRLGGALSARGRRKEADDRFRTALHMAEAVGDTILLARAAIGLAATVRYGVAEAERIDALERALALLPPDDEVLRTMAAAMLKRQLGFELSDAAYQRRQAAARIVLDAVSVSPLSEELLLTLGTARDAIMVDDPTVLERLSRQTIAVAVAKRKLNVLAHGWYGRAWAALELGDAPAWREATAAFTEVAAELDLPFEQALASTMAATTALIEGRYGDARQWAERALTLGAEVDPNAGTIHLTNAVMVGLDTGEAPAMVELMAASRSELEQVPTFLAGFAITATLGGATEVARGLLEEFAAPGFEALRRDLEWLPVMGFLGHVAAALGATEHAATLYDLLAAHPARAVRVGPVCGWWGPTDHHLGALCRLMGRLDEAKTRLRRAMVVCESFDARPWRARCQLELARILELQAGAATRESLALRAGAEAAISDLGAVGISTN